MQAFENIKFSEVTLPLPAVKTRTTQNFCAVSCWVHLGTLGEVRSC
jgi:predicted neutral ceramidase superfamily lipid hydrolase